MYRNLRPIFELTPDDFVDTDQLRVDRFFRQLGRRIPPWLAPDFLKIVAGQANLEDFRITRCILYSVNPDGSP
jgi:hypothetical protein